jgi:hypothetical protein
MPPGMDVSRDSTWHSNPPGHQQRGALAAKHRVGQSSSSSSLAGCELPGALPAGFFLSHLPGGLFGIALLSLRLCDLYDRRYRNRLEICWSVRHCHSSLILIKVSKAQLVRVISFGKRNMALRPDKRALRRTPCPFYVAPRLSISTLDNFTCTNRYDWIR